MKKLFFLVTIIFLAGTINSVAAKALSTGDAAHDFSLPDITGKTVSLQTILQNKRPIALVFWASWCSECRKQLPDINAAAKKYADKLQFFGINTNDSMAGAIAYVKKESIEFPVLVDASGVVADSYGVIGVPTVVLIDKNGVIQTGDLDIRKIDAYLQKTK